MDWNRIIEHACAFGLLIIFGCCIWLSIVLIHYVKRARKLGRQLRGKDKLVLDEHEKVFSE